MNDINRFGATVKVFRGKVGFTAQAVTARDEFVTHTLNLELADKISSGYDWANKTTVQVSRAELPRFCAVLIGLKRRAEGKYHGETKNKSWHLVWGDEGLGLKLSDKGKWRSVFFGEEDLFWLSSLCVDQLGRNTGAETQSDTLNMLKLSCRSRD